MVNKQKALSLPIVGLVITIPSGAGLASSTGTRSSVDVSSTALGSETEASRRAFLASASYSAFAPPVNAAMNFGYIKRNGKWRRIGGGSSDSDSSNSSSGSSDDESVSSSDDEEGKETP